MTPPARRGRFGQLRDILDAPWHPLGFAAAWVLNAWISVAISPYAMVRALLTAIAFALAITLVGWLILGNLNRGALLASAMVGFAVLGRELAIMVRNAVSLLPAWQTMIVAAAFLAALGAIGVISWRWSGHSGGDGSWRRSLNGLAGVLLILILVMGLADGAAAQAIADLHQGVPLEAAPERSDERREGPDIYVILLDAYARGDVLNDQFGFDNTPFLDALTDRGFHVAPASHSNYMLTQLSLTSLFEMALVQDVPALKSLINSGAPDQPTARRALNDNPSFDLLRERGYTIAAFATSYESVALRQADVLIDGPQVNEFEWHILASTFLLDTIDWISPDLIASQQRAVIDSAFDHATEVAQARSLGPRFLFAHVLAPRSPLVYGANGEPLELEVLRRTNDTAAAAGLTVKEWAKRMVGQTQYVNGRTLELVDAILAASPDPPVIVIMSDHGSRSQTLDPLNHTPDEVRERFGTLFAAYTPGQEAVFPPDVTPAEVMGRLFNAYFGLPFEAPRDGIFASEANDPFRLVRLGDAPPPSR
jgi:hypothetical protein